MNAEQILAEFPHLDLGRIHAALAYYYANQEQIEADLEAERRLGEELAAKYPHGWTRETDRPQHVLPPFVDEDSMGRALIRGLR